MYQLLPPDSVRILQTVTLALLPAMVPGAWFGNNQAHLDAAREVHAMLEKPLPVTVRCVYASGHETPWLYRVKLEFRVTATYAKPPGGDGTVIANSAINGTELPDRDHITEGETAHDDLPCNSKVNDIIRSLVEQVRAGV
jgi:hypothetical protein